jgi:hypothetical protein
MAKASKLDMQNREKDIQECMAHGKTRVETCRELAVKWKVSAYALERQYDGIVQDMEKVVEAGRAELRAKLMLRNDDIFKRCMAEGIYKTALEANNSQAKLAGLLSDKKDAAVEPPKLITISERENAGLELVKSASGNE